MLSANERKGKNTSNDNYLYLSTGVDVNFLKFPEGSVVEICEKSKGILRDAYISLVFIHVMRRPCWCTKQ